VQSHADNEYDQTPLLWAAGNGHVAVVGLLLKRGEIETLNKGERTSLYLAIKEKYSAMARLLVENGTDPTSINRNGVQNRQNLKGRL
jgi:ankyrin repeat protein